YEGSAVRETEQRLSMYLNGEMIKSILTPGEFVEWKIDLKAGEVVVAEASSDSFDPALELLDSEGTVVSKNDDRYPGDQRPLLFWRCDKDGSYRLHVRSYKDKAGGQVFTRFKTYETLDVPATGTVKGRFSATQPFLVRVPMKAGELKDVIPVNMGNGNYINYRFDTLIFPDGLPYPTRHRPILSEGLPPAIGPAVAPLAGDYYYFAVPYGYSGGDGWVSLTSREIVPTAPETAGGVLTGKATTNSSAVWEFPVKAGQFLEVSMPGLSLNCTLSLSEAPDFSKFSFDPSHPELNPSYPTLRNRPPDPEPAFDMLPKRQGDDRIFVFRARRDAKLWLASNGAGPDDKPYSLAIKPAANAWAPDQSDKGDLRIADTDYWAFDANAGDVMNLSLTTKAFRSLVIVRQPDLNEIRHSEETLDQTTDEWRMIVQKPGQYLVAVACLGNGGGGEYALSRKVYHAADFSRTSPAKGEIGPGQVQVWKFTATPNDPLLIHWHSTNWSYDVAIYDDKGNPQDFQRQSLDGQNQFGILKVEKPQTFVIVLSGKDQKATYSIDLGPVPGFRSGG
ncbi:MAG TPA: hypothetical protein VMI31_10655, partial [Fimbriimonadaceae bacterium]|nr:hypothetical protein [Fimbriimonadaceae bacterium]